MYVCVWDGQAFSMVDGLQAGSFAMLLLLIVIMHPDIGTYVGGRVLVQATYFSTFTQVVCVGTYLVSCRKVTHSSVVDMCVVICRECVPSASWNVTPCCMSLTHRCTTYTGMQLRDGQPSY